ncbi:MAG: RDD family protein [Gammaproteobacteria bacterium]
MYSYPRVLRRLRALAVDSIIIPSVFIAIIITVSTLIDPGIHVLLSAGFAVFILEPLMVSVTGGTVGHHLLGLRVIHKRTFKNLNIFSVTLRSLVKLIVGLLSVVSIFTTRQHKAIHDLLAGSIVVLKNPQTLSSYEVLTEREFEEKGYDYATKPRQISVIIIYNLMLMAVVGSLPSLLVSEPCVINDNCSKFEELTMGMIFIFWMISSVLLIVMARKGFLLGCRRRSSV